MTVQVVLGTKHDISAGGDTELQMKINGKRFADSGIDYGHPANFAIYLLLCKGAKTDLLSSTRRAEGGESDDIQILLLVSLVADVPRQNRSELLV